MMANIIPTLKIRRKIDISKIKAVTISRLGYEFVIHVPSEYDYRYSSEKYYLFFFFNLKYLCYFYVDETKLS